MLIKAILLSLIAGCMNGSYPAFLKKVTFPTDFIWFVFSLLTFGLAPWIALSLLGDHSLLLLESISLKYFYILLIGGFCFGLGMILFVFGLKYVGISVSFILNIAVGTVIGSILPVILLNPSKLASAGGLAQITALIVFLIALCFMMTASKNREATVSEKSVFKGKNIIGILVGSLSGLLTSAQGFVYSYCLPFVTSASVSIDAPKMTSTLLIWALIFNAALLPYALFFLVRFLRSNEKLTSKHSFKNSIFLIVMSIFYYGSIIVFSKASISLGSMGSVIAWPILMITIILTSNFWGWKQCEWKNSGIKAIKSQKASIVFLLIAVVLLTVAGYFNLS